MRYVYILLIAVAVGILFLFQIQNLTAITVSFMDMSVTMPVTFLIVGVYLLGMFTGSAVVGLLRTWARGAMHKPQN